VREFYHKANPIILEPIMKVEVESPEEFQGAILGGLNQRRGLIIGTTASGNIAVITAEVPLAEMFGYSNDIRSATQGKATFTMEFAKYSPVPKQKQEELIKKYQEEKAKAQK
jgi:elongation factor G